MGFGVAHKREVDPWRANVEVYAGDYAGGADGDGHGRIESAGVWRSTYEYPSYFRSTTGRFDLELKVPSNHANLDS